MAFYYCRGERLLVFQQLDGIFQLTLEGLELFATGIFVAGGEKHIHFFHLAFDDFGSGIGDGTAFASFLGEHQRETFDRTQEDAVFRTNLGGVS